MTQLLTPKGASLGCPLRGPILAARGPAWWGGDDDVTPAFDPGLLPALPCSNILGSDSNLGSTFDLVWPPSPASPTLPQPRSQPRWPMTDPPRPRLASVFSFQPLPAPLGLVRPPSLASPTLPRPWSQPRWPRTDPPRPQTAFVSSSRPLLAPLSLVRPPSSASLTPPRPRSQPRQPRTDPPRPRLQTASSPFIFLGHE